LKPVPILQCLALVLLFAWRLMPEPYLEWLLLPLWVMSGWLIFASSLEAARLRRRAWLDQYLLVSSPWHTRWRGGWLMSLWHLVLAALLALFMLVRLFWPFTCRCCGYSASCSGAGCKGTSKRLCWDH